MFSPATASVHSSSPVHQARSWILQPADVGVLRDHQTVHRQCSTTHTPASVAVPTSTVSVAKYSTRIPVSVNVPTGPVLLVRSWTHPRVGASARPTLFAVTLPSSTTAIPAAVPARQQIAATKFSTSLTASVNARES